MSTLQCFFSIQFFSSMNTYQCFLISISSSICFLRETMDFKTCDYTDPVLVPTYLPTHYTRWYLVAAAPLADAPSPVVHLLFFAPECRAASALRSARTTAPSRTSYCAQFFPSLQRLFTFIFCAEIGSRIAPEVDISFCAFLRTTFWSFHQGEVRQISLSLFKIASSLLLHWFPKHNNNVWIWKAS